jgi:hypothetical protein
MSYLFNSKGSTNFGYTGSGTRKTCIASDGTYLYVGDDGEQTLGGRKCLYAGTFNGSTFTKTSQIDIPTVTNPDWPISLVMGPPGWIFVVTGEYTGGYIASVTLWAFAISGGVFTGTYWYTLAIYATGATPRDLYYDTDGYIYVFCTSDYRYVYTFSSGTGFTQVNSNSDSGRDYRTAIMPRTGGGLVFGTSMSTTYEIRAYTFTSGGGWVLCGSLSTFTATPCGLGYDGTYYYLATSQESGQGKIHKLSYDGSSFTLITTITLPNYVQYNEVYSITTDGQYLFFALRNYGIGVYDLTLTSRFVYLDSNVQYYCPRQLYYRTPYLYMCSNDNVRALKLDLQAQFSVSALTGHAPLTINFTAV